MMNNRDRKGGKQMDQLSVMSIRLNDRDDIAPQVQEIPTQNGRSDFRRFGIHDPGENQP